MKSRVSKNVMVGEERLCHRSERAVEKARAVIMELGIEGPEEIDIELIAAHYHVYVMYRALTNQEGHLLRSPKTGLIVVDASAQRTNKWRFVIAHELGHYLLHPDEDHFHVCMTQDLDGARPRNKQEAEANDFAAELLMPSSLMGKVLESLRWENFDGLHTISAYAKRFDTSLTAMALHVVKSISIPCALVQSKRGRIEWCTANAAFRPRLKRGAKLRPDAYAARLFQGEDVPHSPLPNHGGAWSGTLRTQNLPIFEHSFRQKRYDRVLSLLWHDPKP